MKHHQLRLAANKLLKIIIACTLLAALSANANPVRIAVASNFKQTLEAILPAFEQAYPKTEVQVISGSTGGLYAQIMHGAPFDLFLAADSERPKKLLNESKALKIFHYATGQLVYWAPTSAKPVGTPTLISISTPIAIPNHRTAPYGAAARQTMANLNIAGKQFVTGNNVSQSFQFVDSGNVASGFVALSQVRNRVNEAQWWLIPAQHHEPIVQYGVLLSDHHIDAPLFLDFLMSDKTQTSIARRGYVRSRAATDSDQSLPQPIN